MVVLLLGMSICQYQVLTWTAVDELWLIWTLSNLQVLTGEHDHQCGGGDVVLLTSVQGSLGQLSHQCCGVKSYHNQSYQSYLLRDSPCIPWNHRACSSRSTFPVHSSPFPGLWDVCWCWPEHLPRQHKSEWQRSWSRRFDIPPVSPPPHWCNLRICNQPSSDKDFPFCLSKYDG